MFTELVKLDAQLDRCLILIVNPKNLGITWYLTGKEGLLSNNGLFVHNNSYPSHQAYLQGWRTRLKKWHYLLAGEEKRDWDAFGFTQTGLAQLPDFIKSDMAAVEAIHLTISSDDFGCLIASSFSPLSESLANIVDRFTLVFNQTYTRFLDLQKAEAQAREAQIEAALERVRSKTMAMHNSADVGESVATLFDELLTLGVLSANDRCGIGIMHPDEIMEAWTAAKTVEGKAELTIGYLNMAMHPLLKAAYGGWKTKKETNQYILQGDDKHNYHEAIRNQSDYKIKRDYFSSLERIVHTDFYFTEGCLYVFSSNEFTSGSASIFIRFTNVFGQTYRRYLDLQKAEAQAREAQIEAALERVRASTMAMHKSEQLAETAKVLFEQFDLLGKIPDRISIGIIKEEKQLIEWWVTNQNGSQLNYGFNASIAEPSMAKVFSAWKEKKDSIVIDLTGNDLQDWIRFVREEVKMEIDEANMKGRRVHQGAFFSQGVLLFSTHEPVATDVMQLLVRFARVFSQTYTRFLDLQKAEMQAKEAIKASSLDRVRGEIASMRTIDDLQRITPIIWHELIALGVPFIRCGVFIINESTSHIQVFLSAPDGKSLAAMDLPFNSSELTINSVIHWRQGIIFKTHWNKQEFLNFMQSMIKEGQVRNPKTYQGAAAPPESLDLHFVPFKQGMLYVGNSSPLEIDELQLVKSLAESFSIAYARYEDFRQLEEAKNQIEKTFSELKAAQSQLIQAEKMASLGELTAGIAHEIQNPLNFVNNFSELSKELIGEMNDELAVGNWQLAKEIAVDVEQNLEKINHHGKRAADIVKGMLQHSRTSSGVKEPTDINALADEYLRLAFHGLKAKDKSFNADFKTDLDPNLPKINVIPQDIGRVLLNLINNAFYAVDKRAKSNDPLTPEGGMKNDQIKYVPTVTISTTFLNPPSGGRGVKVVVKDNGDGIPPHIVDKIFQPFFTTKPTGQGTGLGLSLSYDIVKAQGGEFKVETKHGEGSEFIIELPIN
jgi:signal transduction histidine kinase